MQDVFFVLTVTDRVNGEKFINFTREHGASIVFSLPGEGTAGHDMLSMLGLEATEKAVLFSVLTGEAKKKLLRGLVGKMCIDIPGAGIALSVPVGSIGGNIALKALLGEQELAAGEEKAMNTMPYSLITVIANSGCTDMVMDAARSAGATGGTVLHVKGAGAAHAEKFFGMSIADEKEMILIATTREQAGPIMKAVMAQAGLNTRAHAISFSMPVDQIAGFRLTRPGEENEE